MENKNKRLEKILSKKGIKGILKPVADLESSHLELAVDKRCLLRSMVCKKEDYKTVLQRGVTFPPENVYFLVNSNKRNDKKINDSLTKNYAFFEKKKKKKKKKKRIAGKYIMVSLWIHNIF